MTFIDNPLGMMFGFGPIAEVYPPEIMERKMCEIRSVLGDGISPAQRIADILSDHIGAHVTAGMVKYVLNKNWPALKKNVMLVMGETVAESDSNINDLALNAALAIDNLYAIGGNNTAQRTAKVQIAVREAIKTYAGRCK